GLATIGAIALHVESGLSARPGPSGATPEHGRPDESLVGTPWMGAPAIVERVADLEARSVRPRSAAGQVPRRASEPPPQPTDSAGQGGTPQVAFTLTTQFDGPTSADSPFVPPDSTGAAGPNQIMMGANGRIEIFSKAGILASSFTDSSLWASVTANTVSHP